MILSYSKSHRGYVRPSIGLGFLLISTALPTILFSKSCYVDWDIGEFHRLRRVKLHFGFNILSVEK